MDYKNEMFREDKNMNKPCDADGCFKECNFYTGVNLPVEIKPCAEVGDIEVTCCGDPTVKKEGTDGCTHKICITQNFFIKIPVNYRVFVDAGKCESECNEK